jgi:hypothetical protein
VLEMGSPDSIIDLFLQELLYRLINFGTSMRYADPVVALYLNRRLLPFTALNS